MQEQSIRDYFGTWNDHNASKLARLFTKDGTYEDPISRMAVYSWDLATVLWSIETVLPDLKFEVVALGRAGNYAFAEWILRGTNAGPLKAGIDPTGKVTSLRGIDVFEGSDGFTRVQRYFDQKTLYEQIGMQVIVELLAQGKATYGYSKRVASRNPAPPAAVGMTWIRFRSQSELDYIRSHSARIIQDFLDEPGFISIVTGAAGDRAFTVTAWESEEAMHHALDKSHSRAKHDFRTGDLSPGVWTSVWKPARINRIWTRCPACNQPNDVTEDHRGCTNCGTTLPERPPYW